MEKDIFYDKMQPYFDENMVREVYSCEYFSILNVGEVCYVACPYIYAEDGPLGIFMNEKVIRKIVDNNRYIYPIAEEIFRDLERSKRAIFSLSEKRMPFWKQWIVDNHKRNKSNISPQLEEELHLKTNSNSKKSGV